MLIAFPAAIISGLILVVVLITMSFINGLWRNQKELIQHALLELQGERAHDPSSVSAETIALLDRMLAMLKSDTDDGFTVLGIAVDIKLLGTLGVSVGTSAFSMVSKYLH